MNETMSANLPSRHDIAAAYFADEEILVSELVGEAAFSQEEAEAIARMARRLVEAARSGRRRFGNIDGLMQEYGLDNEEGVLLMCLAEALLRIPDQATADQLIADKIGSGDWQLHVGNAESLLVNASTWGLLLTGRFLAAGQRQLETDDPFARLKKWAQRSGEPMIREAMRRAMRILGEQFVMGRTMDEAMRKAGRNEGRLLRYSYDLLGEASMTQADADACFVRYVDAIEKLAVSPEVAAVSPFWQRSSISVKLSALHPRFEPSQYERVMSELLPRMKLLAKRAKDAHVGLTIDAEEMDRLDMTLGLFAEVFIDHELEDFEGLGLAVQAYGRRTRPVLRWLLQLARSSGRRIPVRLVKGAYWDSEIKQAQMRGLDSYPVFTRKSATDVSYLAAARFLLRERRYFFLQFATHNAHTLAAVQTMAKQPDGLEFQRLYGMGEAIYDEMAKAGGDWPVRVYAPVGGHEELLAYLVRRLLENGANSSFVNRLADDEAPINSIIANPVETVRSRTPKQNPKIPAPTELFQPARRNSSGLLLSDDRIRRGVTAAVESEMHKRHDVAPVVGGALVSGEPGPDNLSPQDNQRVVGSVRTATAPEIDRAIELARQAQDEWDRQGGAERGRLLEMAADRLEANRFELMSVMILEAGKTLENALGDVREAVDFLRYYAVQARTDFVEPVELTGVTGESNKYSLHGRGVFACISPWNFPLAIFIGQIAAALAAGNTVVAKPAEQTPATAFLAFKLLHEAGIPNDVLHLLPGDGAVVGTQIVKDARIAGIAFTGSIETAQIIRRTVAERSGPIVPLIAETGGINAMIVDSSALPEQVVRDVLRSAFDSAGQRCSALRVLYVQEDVAPRMLDLLAGAMQELRIGDPLNYATDIGPVIDVQARDELEAYKTKMRETAKTIGELTLPVDCDNGTFVAPAVYEIGSIRELEKEIFGPILHVVRYPADALEKICDDINATGYGLTLGIHSRIEKRIDFVTGRMRIGNLYVNRNQIGAVVGVQPFGGVGLSGTGPKAGSPNTLRAFASERVVSIDTTAAGGNASLVLL